MSKSGTILELIDEMDQAIVHAAAADTFAEMRRRVANARLIAARLRQAIERPTGEFQPLSREKADKPATDGDDIETGDAFCRTCGAEPCECTPTDVRG